MDNSDTGKKPRGRKPKDDTFHGTFVRDRGEGRGPRVAGPKATDLSKINKLEAWARLEQMEASKVPGSFPVGSSPTRFRKTKLAVMGLSSAVLDAGDPRYAACMRLANAWRKIRSREMYVAHGYVSTGASTLLASAAMALAGARFLYEIAASAEEGQAGLIKTASSLSDSARQNELSAWELCARESVVRKRNDQNSVSLPWLTGQSGGEQRKPGRPRKALLVESNLCPTPFQNDSEQLPTEPPPQNQST